MLLPARQSLPRWTCRVLFMLLIFAGIVWVAMTQIPVGSLGYDTSQQYYQVFIDTAKRLTLAKHAADDSGTVSSATLSPSNDEIPSPLSSDMNSSAVAVLSPIEQEYQLLTDTTQPRVKAAFVVLARNQEVHRMRSSMRYLEDRFNHKFNYPWIFLNEEPFSEEFITLTRQMTNAETFYDQVPAEHWSYPEWINQTYAQECRQRMEDAGIIYGGSESYRHMCRFQSGFFYMHPLLDNLDYYWRVEPGVKFSCDIDYDPFRVMEERDLKYGFTIALGEYFETVLTLWDNTLEFIKNNPQHIYPPSSPDSLFKMVTDDNGWTYNLCHFWSNFEIGSIAFLRSEGYQAYFRHLDQSGGFFYERWGDAPVHSIAVALMLSSEEVHWFYDIGYKHDFFEHCPTEPDWLVHGKCYCEPNTSFDYTPGSCINKYLQITNTEVTDFLITRPDDP